MCLNDWFWTRFIKNHRRCWEKINFDHTLNKKNSRLSWMRSWCRFMVHVTCQSITQTDYHSKIKRCFGLCSISSKWKSSVYKKTIRGSNLCNFRRQNSWRNLFQENLNGSIWWSSKSPQSSQSYRRLIRYG